MSLDTREAMTAQILRAMTARGDIDTPSLGHFQFPPPRPLPPNAPNPMLASAGAHAWLGTLDYAELRSVRNFYAARVLTSER